MEQKAILGVYEATNISAELAVIVGMVLCPDQKSSKSSGYIKEHDLRDPQTSGISRLTKV